MNLINGNEIAQKILAELKAQAKQLSFSPLFCDVLIGSDPVAASYVKIKARRAEEIGLKFELIELPKEVTTAQVVAKIFEVQKNQGLAGLIVQLPLPEHLDRKAILNAIDPKFDVDCLGEINNNLFYQGHAKLLPPTAAAVMAVLESVPVDLKQSQILVVGQGELVGKPVTFLLRQNGYTVRTADDSTNLNVLLPEADVIIAGVGQPRLIRGEMIKSGSVIIDCGTSESAGSIVGDVDSESVAAKASYLAAVPGGVGPVTVARLLYNVMQVTLSLKK